MVWAQAREYRPDSVLAKLSKRGVPSSATWLVGIILLISCVVGQLSGIDLEFFLKLANGVFVLVYLLAMFAAFRLVQGFAKVLSVIALILCTGVFICLGWSMIYALAIFSLFAIPWKKGIKTQHPA